MKDSQQLREEMWDLVYGLLEADESRALIARIKSDPQAARLYAEVRLQADLVGYASRVEDASLVLGGRAETAASGGKAAAAATIPAAKGARQPFPRAGAWLAGIAASALALLVAVGLYWPGTSPVHVAENLVVVDVEAARSMSPGRGAGPVRLRTESIDGVPQSAALDVAVVDAAGRQVFFKQLESTVDGNAEFDLPEEAIVPGASLQVAASPASDAKAAGASDSDLPALRNETAGGVPLAATSLSVPLPVQPEPGYVYLLAESPVLEPGQTARFSIWNFSSTGALVPAQLADLAVEDSTGQPVAAPAWEMDADTGVITGQTEVPPDAEGDLALSIRPIAGDKINLSLGVPVREALSESASIESLARGEGPDSSRLERKRDANALAAADKREKLLADAAPPAAETVRMKSEIPAEQPLSAGVQKNGQEFQDSAADLAAKELDKSRLPDLAAGNRFEERETLAPARLIVEMSDDKADWRPGETVSLQVQVVDENGQPAPHAQLGVRVWNERLAARFDEPPLLAAALGRPTDVLSLDTGTALALAEQAKKKLAENAARSAPAGGKGQFFRSLALDPQAAQQQESAETKGRRSIAAGAGPSQDAADDDTRPPGDGGVGLAMNPAPADGAYYNNYGFESDGAELATQVIATNRPAVEAEWEAARAIAESQRREARTAIGLVLVVGGVGLLVLIGLQFLFRLPLGARVLVPALAVVAASLLLGASWIGWQPMSQWREVAMTTGADDWKRAEAAAKSAPPAEPAQAPHTTGAGSVELSDNLNAVQEVDAQAQKFAIPADASPAADAPAARSLGGASAGSSPPGLSGAPQAAAAAPQAAAPAPAPTATPSQTTPPVMGGRGGAFGADRDGEEGGIELGKPKDAVTDREQDRRASRSVKERLDKLSDDRSEDLSARMKDVDDARAAEKAVAKPSGPARAARGDNAAGAVPTTEAPPPPAPAPALPAAPQNSPSEPREPASPSVVDRGIDARSRKLAMKAGETLADPAAAPAGADPLDEGNKSVHERDFDALPAERPAAAGLRRPRGDVRQSAAGKLAEELGAAPASLYFHPQLIADENGRATIEFTLPPVESEYRVLIDAVGNGRLGSAVGLIRSTME